MAYNVRWSSRAPSRIWTSLAGCGCRSKSQLVVAFTSLSLLLYLGTWTNSSRDLFPPTTRSTSNCFNNKNKNQISHTGGLGKPPNLLLFLSHSLGVTGLTYVIHQTVCCFSYGRREKYSDDWVEEIRTYYKLRWKSKSTPLGVLGYMLTVGLRSIFVS